MNKEFDSSEELKHDAKLLRGKLHPVRHYVDPYVQSNEHISAHTDYMERWSDPEVRYQLP